MGKLFSTFVLGFSLLAAGDACAQSYYTTTEFSVSLGGSQYFGDLNENYGFKTIAPVYGVYMRKRLGGYIALKAVANYTDVGYDDKMNKVPYEVARNLNFKSNIYEVAVQAEFNFFKFATGDPYHRFTPYITSGIGAFYYDPYTTYKGVKYNLREQGTEGQNAGYGNRKYGKVSPCFPLGVGIKYWIRPGVNFAFEIADRLTTTDYLDDVSTTYVGVDKFKKVTVANPSAALQDRSLEVQSEPALGRPGKQRGNSSNYDQYIMATFSLSWHFTTYRCPQDLNADLIRVK
ncbi:MAG: hypothetical protein H7257_00185 [Taibaiella sp.]|nr:hypothetical protein [Taibaiella sp.]